jgi:DNA mismatch endonuclease Vsr
MSRVRAVIFVHGYIWHQNPDPDFKLSRLRKSQREFWEPKLRANRSHDVEVEHRLNESGWSVLNRRASELRASPSVVEKVQVFFE